MEHGLKEAPAVTPVDVPGAAPPGAGGMCAAGEVITTSGLSKTFPRDIHAVVALDLHVQAGEIFGLLGPNGAGKTTTVGMLSTRVVPTAGNACASNDGDASATLTVPSAATSTRADNWSSAARSTRASRWLIDKPRL